MPSPPLANSIYVDLELSTSIKQHLIGNGASMRGQQVGRPTGNRLLRACGIGVLWAALLLSLLILLPLLARYGARRTDLSGFNDPLALFAYLELGALFLAAAGAHLAHRNLHVAADLRSPAFWPARVDGGRKAPSHSESETHPQFACYRTGGGH